MSDAVKTIRIISFDDKKSSFRKWSKKFLAAAKSRGYKDILLGNQIVPDADMHLDESDETEKLLTKAREANEKAYNDLILACDGDIGFNIVDTAVTNDLPDGDAKLAWKNLHSKFMPKTSANKIQLMAEFANSSLSNWKRDPDMWINELEILRSRIRACGHTIDDEALIIHILNNLPEKYDNLVENLESKVGGDQPLTLEDLHAELNLKFTKWKIRAEKEGDTEFDSDYEDKEDTALIAAGFKKPFKGRCRNCGKFGHKAVDCPQKTGFKKNSFSDSKSKFNGKCFYCGKWGHMKKDCLKLKEDKKNKIDNAMVMEEEDDYGVLAFTACVECTIDKKDENKKIRFVEEVFFQMKR